MVTLTYGRAFGSAGAVYFNQEMKMIELPPRQLEALKFIADTIDKRQYAPSQQEIANAMGLSSLNSVSQNLAALESKGVIGRKAKAARALWVTEAGRELLNG